MCGVVRRRAGREAGKVGPEGAKVYVRGWTRCVRGRVASASALGGCIVYSLGGGRARRGRRLGLGRPYNSYYVGVVAVSRTPARSQRFEQSETTPKDMTTMDGTKHARDSNGVMRWMYMNDGPKVRGGPGWKNAPSQEQAEAGRRRVLEEKGEAASTKVTISPTAISKAVKEVVTPHFQEVRAAPLRPASSTLQSLHSTLARAECRAAQPHPQLGAGEPQGEQGGLPAHCRAPRCRLQGHFRSHRPPGQRPRHH